MTVQTNPETTEESGTLSNARLKAEAQRDAAAAVRDRRAAGGVGGMDKAVVVRESASGQPSRTAVVDREVAEALALKGWIACDEPGASRGIISPARGGGARADAGRGRERGQRPAQAARHSARRGRGRHGAAAPGALWSGRKSADRAGPAPRPGWQPFLSDDLVRAGERLREDFELAQMGARVTQNWDRFLSHVDDGGTASGPRGYNAEAARARVIGALRDLGPGLGDVALRCCCRLEGLERAEKKMGWSARSGKIVLRIALQRLKRHYESLGEAGGLIG